MSFAPLHISPRFVNIPSVHLSDYDYGLVWKVMGYDDRYPEQYDLNIFKRVGVYGSLNNNNLHDNIMGACEFECMYV